MVRKPRKKKNVYNSRTVKSRDWHLKKMVDLTEQTLRHGEEIPEFVKSQTMKDLQLIYLAMNAEYLKELKRKIGN